MYLIEKETNNNLRKSKILPDIALYKMDEKSYVKYFNKKIEKRNNFSILNDPLYKSLDSQLSKIIV